MKKTLIILLALLFCLSGYAQNRRKTPERKFIYMTSVGYATGLGEISLPNENGDELKTVQNKTFNISVNQLLGYQFNPYFQMGIGAGFDFWHYTAFIPVYLNLTVNFTDTKIEPMFYLNAGYSFKWYVSSVPEKMDRVVHGTKSGPTGESGIGMRINLNEKLSLVLAACYKVQYTDIRYTIPHPDEQDFSAYSTNAVKNALYHFAGVRLGIQF
jgi:hypothetical protein